MQYLKCWHSFSFRTEQAYTTCTGNTSGSYLGKTLTERIEPCESQPHKGHLTSKSNYRWFPSYLLCTLILLPFIFYLPQCTLPDFTSVSSRASLPFLSCCHHNNKKCINGMPIVNGLTIFESLQLP